MIYLKLQTALDRVVGVNKNISYEGNNATAYCGNEALNHNSANQRYR